MFEICLIGWADEMGAKIQKLTSGNDANCQEKFLLHLPIYHSLVRCLQQNMCEIFLVFVG
jgi:hypothetical protein